MILAVIVFDVVTLVGDAEGKDVGKRVFTSGVGRGGGMEEGLLVPGVGLDAGVGFEVRKTKLGTAEGWIVGKGEGGSRVDGEEVGVEVGSDDGTPTLVVSPTEDKYKVN